MIKLPYKPEIVVIDKENIDNFKFSRFMRDQRTSHINEIKASMDVGKHFHMPLAVFKKGNGKFQVGGTKSEMLDGNHRLNAIKKKIDEDPTFSIEVLLMVYNIDSDIDKTLKEIYHCINIGRKQNTDDYIQAYKNKIPIYDEIVKSKVLPCSIYGNRDEMKFYHIIGGYLRARDPVYKGTWTGKPKDFVEEAKKLTSKDVEIIEQFWKDFTKMFKLSGVQNIRSLACTKTTGFSVIFFIWYHNKDRLGRAKVVEKIRDKLAGTKLFEEQARSPGIANSRRALDALVRRLNKGAVSKYYFKNQ